jgi:hypothetical protein
MRNIPIEKVHLSELPPGNYWTYTGKPFMRGPVKHYPRNEAYQLWDGQEWQQQPHHVILEPDEIRLYTEWSA